RAPRRRPGALHGPASGTDSFGDLYGHAARGDTRCTRPTRVVARKGASALRTGCDRPGRAGGGGARLRRGRGGVPRRPRFPSGKECYLRPLRREDAAGPWKDWFNDPEVTRHMIHGELPSTYESTLAYYESIAVAQDCLQLAVILRDGDRHVGNIGLNRI